MRGKVLHSQKKGLQVSKKSLTGSGLASCVPITRPTPVACLPSALPSRCISLCLSRSISRCNSLSRISCLWCCRSSACRSRSFSKSRWLSIWRCLSAELLGGDSGRTVKSSCSMNAATLRSFFGDALLTLKVGFGFFGASLSNEI